ncbi:apolipoprotein N-acyltransferase [Stackebrandtia albiflava]|uniref:Apolipoprotein N-acyltransferase n=1 Tax=Stackebrandtia albiflava TaxID=406432 RepID=A0A562VD89_9ACTN|nr:apolipoprotein N-acyltransferase [Stackebrandtia albiflava]TWJ15781.1 apolipoprotein N-acyltransferase [Stackebrandtia albiflava]
MATAVDTPPQPSPPARPRPRRLPAPSDGPRLPLPLAIVAAALAGPVLLLAFPPYDLWWLAPIGVAMAGVAWHRRRIRAGLGLGMLTGLTFFFPLLSWTSTQVGEVPWIALSILEALYLALLGGAAAFTSRLADRYRLWWPVLVGLLWVGQEALRSRTPFGGFPWGRLAFSQADSPLAQFAWLGGAPMVTFLTAVAGGCLMLLLWHRPRRGVSVRATAILAAVVVAVAVIVAGLLWAAEFAESRGVAIPFPEWRLAPLPTLMAILAAGGLAVALRRAASRRAGAALAAAGVIVVAGLALPVGMTAPAGDTITVAVVQGSVPRLGLDFNAQRRAVLDRHVQATVDLAAAVADGREKQPDIVVWPENSSDIDPMANEDAAAQIQRAADAIGVPIVLGTLQRDADGNRNISVVWSPETGPGFVYVKQHPVPFAEYIPMKPVVRTVAGWIDERMVDGIDRVNGFESGTEPGVIPVGDWTLSGIICFEVAYDDLVRESVTEGAQILAVQTNNATFDNAEANQQMAMVRLRSIEHGRAGLMASTVGVSGFTDAHGGVYDLTTFDTQAVIVTDLRLGEGTTPATTLGPLPELLACAAALAAVVAAGVVRRRDRVASRDDSAPTTG